MVDALVTEVLKGSPRAIARLATLIENRGEQADEILQAIYPSTGKAHVIGITGPPGAGKSSLIDKLVAAYRADGHRVAVVAVDPSSARTGGAALGDRVRMNSAYGDDGVFVRSMASRGQTDGLALGTAGIVHLLDAAGFAVVLVETVGVGQEQIDIAGIAHTIVLLQVPGSGDAVQFLKAGILEFADVIVVNKSDLPGAAELRKDLRAAISEASQLGIDWSPQIVTTSATQDQGVRDLVSAIDAHAAHMKSSGEFERRSRAIAEREVLLSMHEQMQRKILAGTQPQQAALVEEVVSRQISPAAAARQLIDWQPSS